jgi:hypothetical protein
MQPGCGGELGKNMSREKIGKNVDRWVFMEIFGFIVFVYKICSVGASASF